MSQPNDSIGQLVAAVLGVLGPAAAPIWLAGSAVLVLLLVWLTGRESLRDPAPSVKTYLFLVLVLVAWSRLPGVSLSGLSNPDESFWITTAAVFRVDPRPWLAVDTTTGGPLIPLPLLLTGLFGGEIGWGGSHATAIGVWLVSLVLLYAALSIRFGGRVARLALLPLAITVAFFRDEWDFLSFNGEHVGNLLVCAALLADAVLTRSMQRTDGEGSTGAALTLGAVLGAAPWVKLQMAPIAAAIGLLRTVDLVRRKELRLCGLMIAASLAPTAAFLALLTGTGAIHDFWVSYVLHNLYYASAGLSGMFGGEVIPYRRVLLTYPIQIARRAELLPVFLVPLGLLFVAGIRSIRTRSLPDTAVFAGLFVVAVAAQTTMQTRLVFGHYLLLMLPPLAFLCGALIHDLGETTPGAPPGPLDQRFALAFLAFAVILPATLLLARPNPGFDSATREVTPVSEFEDVTAAIRELTDPGDRVAIWGWAAPLWIATGTIPGTRDVHTARQLLPGELQPYFLQRFAADLAEQRAVLFLDAVPMNIHFSDVSRFGHDRFEIVRTAVDADFDYLAEVNGVRIYRRRPAVVEDALDPRRGGIP